MSTSKNKSKLKTKRVSFEFETSLIVSDFLPDTDDFSDNRCAAFEKAATSTKDAVWMAKEDIKDTLNIKRLPPSVKLKVAFSEFDSANVSHACAHWTVKVTGNQAWITKLTKAYAEIWGS